MADALELSQIATLIGTMGESAAQFSPGQAQLLQRLIGSSQGMTSAEAQKKAQKEAEKKKGKGIGAMLGTVGSLAAAPFTGGASLAYLPMATAAGGAIDSAMAGNVSGAVQNAGTAGMGYFGAQDYFGTPVGKSATPTPTPSASPTGVVAPNPNYVPGTPASTPMPQTAPMASPARALPQQGQPAPQGQVTSTPLAAPKIDTPTAPATAPAGPTAAPAPATATPATSAPTNTSAATPAATGGGLGFDPMAAMLLAGGAYGLTKMRENSAAQKNRPAPAGPITPRTSTTSVSEDMRKAAKTDPSAAVAVQASMNEQPITMREARAMRLSPERIAQLKARGMIVDDPKSNANLNALIAGIAGGTLMG